MSVQWFPGHMNKAIRLIEERMPSIDCVIECRDARVPLSSANPLIQKIGSHKPRVIVLTKKDLAIEDKTKKFIALQTNQLILVVNALKDNIPQLLEKSVLQAMEPKFEKDLKKGIRPRAVRAILMGVPNVGKSTLINRLVKKRVAQTANRPGVTQALKQIKVSNKLEVVDSPGLLWPRFETKEQGMNLALCLSVKNTGYQAREVLLYGLNKLIPLYQQQIESLYGVVCENIIEDLMQKLKLSEHEAVNLLLNDIMNHRFGPMTWDDL